MSATPQPRASHQPPAKPAAGGVRVPVAGKSRRFDNDFSANGCDPMVEAPDL